MRNKAVQWFGVGVVVAAGLVLSSCGKDICVFGQGDCAQDILSTTLLLKSSAATVALSSNLTFTPTGGTAPFTYSVVVGGGAVSPTSGTATTFTAPATAATCCVRVTDASNNTADRCVTVQ